MVCICGVVVWFGVAWFIKGIKKTGLVVKKKQQQQQQFYRRQKAPMIPNTRPCSALHLLYCPVRCSMDGCSMLVETSTLYHS